MFHLLTCEREGVVGWVFHPLPQHREVYDKNRDDAHDSGVVIATTTSVCVCEGGGLCVVVVCFMITLLVFSDLDRFVGGFQTLPRT